MESINFGLGVAGFILGLVSVWPKLMAWAGSAKNVYSTTVFKLGALRTRKIQLALTDPCYLVAYFFLNFTLSLSLALCVIAIRMVTFSDGWAGALLILRLILSMTAGLFLGNVIGMSLVVTQAKQNLAKGGG